MKLICLLSNCKIPLAMLLLATGLTTCSAQETDLHFSTDQLGQTTMIPALKETQFYTFDEDLEETLIDDLVMTGFQGIALQTPPIVNLDKHDKLPVLVVRQNNGTREHKFSFDKSGYLIGVNLDSGEFGIVRGLRDPSQDQGKNPAPEVSELEVEIDPGMANNIFTDLTMIDAHTILDIPLEPGRYALSFLWVDWLARPVCITLEATDAKAPATTPMSDEETRELLRDFDEIISNSVVLWQPSSSLERPGVALQVPDQQIKPGSEVWVRGTALIQPGRGQMSKAHIAGTETKLPAGFANTMLMVVSASGEGIWQVNLPIPIDGKHAGLQGDSAGYQFRINLVNFVPEEAFKPGVLLAYIFSGPFAAGPYKIKIGD